MSPRLPILKPREVLRALQKAGFEIHHQSGSHAQLKHPGKPQLRVTVPRHDRGRVLGILVKEDWDTMPIYEYICEDCQTHFEKIVLNKTQEIACPKCAGKKNAIQLSVFSAANGSGNGASAKSSGEFSGGGGSCCGGGCGCN